MECQPCHGIRTGGNRPFILITGRTREHTIFSNMYGQEKTFPGCFSFAFLSLIGLEACPCGPAGSIFHNKAKNMSAMFSLAQSTRVKHESDRTFPADSSSPFPGDGPTVILLFLLIVILLIGRITWSVIRHGITVEIYSTSL